MMDMSEMMQLIEDPNMPKERRKRRVPPPMPTIPQDRIAEVRTLLADLAERRCEVMATLANGHHHRGAIIATPGAWSILVTPEGRRIAVRKRAILGIDCKELLRSFGDRNSSMSDPDTLSIATAAHGEFAPRSVADATDRADSTDRMVIERLMGPGELITLWSGPLMTHGELRSLSQDLAVVVSPQGVRYVPLAGVDEVIGSNRS
jgi:hypothetical protein